MQKIYVQFLLFFDKLYDRFTDMEKKTFLRSFLDAVYIYKEEQADGRILKGLYFDGEEACFTYPLSVKELIWTQIGMLYNI